jgi:NTE family protein
MADDLRYSGERSGMGTTAIVVAGAGARGAYEAGLLSVLVPRLLDEPDREAKDERFLLLGTSAGAINTALLAAFSEPKEAIEHMLEVWGSVGASDVFAGLRTTALRDAASYLQEILGRGSHFKSLLDSSPLHHTVAERLDWKRLTANLESGEGWVKAAGIVTTSCDSGRTVVFLQGKGVEAPPRDDVRGIDYVPSALGVPHVLASAAIPLAFRPVEIEQGAVRGWHIDGGVRLNAPIRPALDLRAERVIVVATTPDPDSLQAAPVASVEPDVFDAAGVVLRAVLTDRMAEDVRALRRTNAMIPARAREVPRKEGQPYRVVPHLYVGPPDPAIIRETANRVFKERYGGWTSQLSDVGVLGHLIGGSTESHGELLSFLFFDPGFHAALVELGKQHAVEVLGPDERLPWRDARP